LGMYITFSVNPKMVGPALWHISILANLKFCNALVETKLIYI
jgi:hypothetical protein